MFQKINKLIMVYKKKHYVFLFPDDIEIFSTDKHSLQSQIYNVYLYSNTWGLTINVIKTKICDFKKRKTNHDFEWNINNEKIEEVDNFCYLGIKFVKTGNLRVACKTLIEQASRAMNNLYFCFKKIPCDLKMKLSLFDKFVVPILLYASEVWGIYNYREIDSLHLKFLKRILGLRKQTINMAVYGELGRLPLHVIAKLRSLKYWLRISGSNNSLVLDAFKSQLTNTLPINYKCWTGKVKLSLDYLGFGDYWY